MIRIIHLSYARIPNQKNAEEWLKRISFYTGILDCMAEKNKVISIHCIGYDGLITINSVEYHFLKLRRKHILLPVRLHRYIKKLQPDVIIVHGLLYSWQVLCLRLQFGRSTKIFIQHHAEKPLRFFRNLCQRLADRFVAGYFFTTKELSEPWIINGLIKDKRKVHEVMEVSSTFIPINKELAKEQTGVSPAHAIFLWVGRLDRNKDPITLLSAFTNFSKQYLSTKLYVIFQTSDLLIEVQNFLSMNPGSVELVGKVNHDDLIYWYNSADFIISTSHYEGSGIAVCEAMSCGCIPILSDIPSFRMMTRNGQCGCLFPYGDALALEEKLKLTMTMDLVLEKSKVLDQFNTNLSFASIANKIYNAVSSG